MNQAAIPASHDDLLDAIPGPSSTDLYRLERIDAIHTAIKAAMDCGLAVVIRRTDAIQLCRYLDMDCSPRNIGHAFRALACLSQNKKEILILPAA